MGIFILPLLLGALVVAIIALAMTIGLMRKNQIGIKEIIYGLITTLVIFGLICASYLAEGRARALGPAFRIPVFMVFIPFIIHIATRKSKNVKLVYLSQILLISIVTSTILGAIYTDLIFGLIDYLGLEKQY